MLINLRPTAVCPGCGRCNHCGRGAYPYVPYPNPYHKWGYNDTGTYKPPVTITYGNHC